MSVVPGTSTSAPVHDEALVVNRRAVIEGSVTYNGEVRVSGKIEGDVRCKTLQITERGLVVGDVLADHVVVFGEVAGTIRAAVLELKAACHVEGEIYHGRLVLEDGCFFEGQSRRDSRLAQGVSGKVFA